MWLNLLTLLMLVLITFFQSLQGLFSALLLFVLSVVSSVVAFSFYEDLYRGLLADWLPAEGQAIALMAIFLLTLTLLRLAVDFGIKGAVLMPMKIDRMGGGVLGFLVALVMTGTTVTAIQMLPADQQVLGFQRHRMTNSRLTTAGVWFAPDRFAVGLADVILNGSMSGKKARTGTFEEVHPDLLAEVDAYRSAGVPYAAKPGSIGLTVEQVWTPEAVVAADGKTPINPDPGNRFLALRVKQSGGASRVFTPLQMRMVATRANRVQYFILRAASSENEVPSAVQPLDRYMMATAPMNLVYEIPSNAAPWYLNFNNQAFAEITEKPPKDQTAPALTTPTSAAEPPKPADRPKPPAPVPTPVRNPVGRTHGADVADQPIVSDDLPGGIAITTNDATAEGAELARGRLRDCHIAIEMSKTSRLRTVGHVIKFDVPSGMKLVQVPLHRVAPGSLMGQAIDFAVRTLQQQWTLIDDAGGTYIPVGAVAIAKVNGTDFLEIQYHVGQENLASGHTLTKWKRITDQDLKSQPDAKLIFLYLVPPGKHIVYFDTGRQKPELDLKVE
jgi:uncharacterized membrane protein required for colicin V production